MDGVIDREGMLWWVQSLRGQMGMWDRGTEELRPVAYRRLWGTIWKTKKIEEDVGWSRLGTRTQERGVLYWESEGATGLGDKLQV